MSLCSSVSATRPRRPLPVIVRTSCETFEVAAKALSAHDIKSRVLYRTDQDDRAFGLVAAGVGITLMPANFASATLRHENLASLMSEVRSWVLTFTDIDQLQAQVSEVWLTIGGVRSIDGIASFEWAEDWGTIVEVDDREGGTLRMPGPPWHFSRSDLPAPSLPCFQGECDAEVLSERGIGADRLETLRRQRVLLSRRNHIGAFDCRCSVRSTGSSVHSSNVRWVPFSA